MACCYVAAYFLSHLIRTCEFLSLDGAIQYNGTASGSYDEKRPIIGGDGSQRSKSGTEVLSISGMTCGECVGNVERALLRVPGVARTRVSLLLQQATVLMSQEHLTTSASLTQAVNDAGYDAVLGPRTPLQLTELLNARQEIVEVRGAIGGIARNAAILFGLNFFASYVQQYVHMFVLGATMGWVMELAAMAVTLEAVYVEGSWIHKSTWRVARKGRVNMNTLISLSTSLGVLLSVTSLSQGNAFARGTSYLQSSCGLIMIVTVGKLVELLSKREAARNLATMFKPMIEGRVALLSPSRQRVPSSILRVSDEIFIDQYTAIPCDCYVISGTSQVDQSNLTGESIPAVKGPGSFLLAGTRNLSGCLVASVHQEEENSSERKLQNAVLESTAKRSGDNDRMDRVLRYFVFGVLLLAVGTSWVVFAGLDRTLPLGFRFNVACERAMAVLASACPCALALAGPTAIVAAIDVAWRRGILLTDGEHTIESLTEVRHLAMDKTGTLTSAALQISRVQLSQQWINREKVFWTLVCAVEERASTHPIVRTLFAAGMEIIGSSWRTQKDHGKVEGLEEVLGQGLSGRVNLAGNEWREVHIGNLTYMQKHDLLDLPENGKGLESEEPSLKCFVGVDGIYAGTIEIQDTIKPEAGAVIHRLQQEGYQITMLTGDTTREAARVAKSLNISEYLASAMPLAKQEYVQQRRSKGEKVAMIGDGINDAAALSSADVGIMMAAENTCHTVGGGVVILGADLRLLPLAFEIARQTRAQIRRNVCWAMLYNGVALALTISGLDIPSLGGKVTPSTAAAMMSLSSIAITLHSIRHRKQLEKLSVATF